MRVYQSAGAVSSIVPLQMHRISVCLSGRAGAEGACGTLCEGLRVWIRGRRLKAEA